MQPVLRCCIAIAIGTALGLPVMAQTSAPDSGTILQTLPRVPTRPDAAPDIENLLQKRRLISDVEDFETTIRAFDVRGATVLTAAEIQAAVRPFTGEKKTFQDILDAAAAVRRRLAADGYFLSDVVVPEQDITSGTVELIVLEGRIGKVVVEYAPDVKIDRKLVEAYMAGIREGELVRTRVIERALFLVNDLRGINANSTFRPGARPGTADLVVTIEKAPILTGYFDFDVNGPVASGQQRVGANLDVNNFLDRGGLLSFRVIRGMDPGLSLGEPQGTQFGRASVVMPFTGTGFRLGASVSRVEYRLGELPEVVGQGFSGTARIGSLFGSYPFIRSRNLNIIANVQTDWRSLEDIRTAEAPAQKHIDAVLATVNADFRDTLLGGGINLVGVTLTRGRLNIETPQTRIELDRATLQTEGSYTKYQVSLTRLQQLRRDWILYGAINWQGADRNLDNSEKMVLGGPYGIRSHGPTQGVGDTGYLGTLELRHGIAGKYVPGNLVGAIFYDFGGIRRNHAPVPGALDPNTDRLDGAGVGAYWEPKGWYVRASVAGRLPRLYLQATKYF